jgi:hypothetical protein
MKDDLYGILFNKIMNATDQSQMKADLIIPAYERLNAYRNLIRKEMQMQNAAQRLVRMLESNDE